MLRLAALVLPVLVFCLAPSPAEAGRWHRESGYLYYCYDDGLRLWYDDGAYYSWRDGGWRWYAGVRHGRQAPYYAAGYYAPNYYGYGQGYYASPWLGYGHFGRDHLGYGHFRRDGHLGGHHRHGHLGHRR
jgi:hypothetical protein